MKRLLMFGVVVMAAFRSVAAEAVSGEAAGAATNGVTLDSLVAQALQKNPELRFYEAEIAAAKAGRRTACLLANPELSGSVGHEHSTDNAGMSAEGVAWSVQLMQPFEPGFCITVLPFRADCSC